MFEGGQSKTRPCEKHKHSSISTSSKNARFWGWCHQYRHRLMALQRWSYFESLTIRRGTYNTTKNCSSLSVALFSFKGSNWSKVLVFTISQNPEGYIECLFTHLTSMSIPLQFIDASTCGSKMPFTRGRQYFENARRAHPRWARRGSWFCHSCRYNNFRSTNFCCFNRPISVPCLSYALLASSW